MNLDHFEFRKAARRIRLGLIVAAAATLLLWAIDRQYLWEDEANTAVLSVRMLRFGKPLAFDGVNFVGLDHQPMEEEEPVDWRTDKESAEVEYYLRHDFLKPDLAWKWHPWGQFVVTAISIKLLGQTTLAARLPFALAGILTVLLLYRLALAVGAGERIAQIAALLLTLNAAWILHERQCRYYALSSLFLVVTLLSYARWQRKCKGGAAVFVASAWCWFQVDFGTVWPVLLLLALDSLGTQWRPGRKIPWNTLATWGWIAAAVAPFAWYYELQDRGGWQVDTWNDRFQTNLSHINQFVIPIIILAAAIGLWGLRWKALPSLERRMVAVSAGALLAMGLWVPSTAVASFLRYTIVTAPVACFLIAWLLVRSVPEKLGWIAWIVGPALVVTSWAAQPGDLLLGQDYRSRATTIYRTDWGKLHDTVFVRPPDVNRGVVEWLKANAKPSDVILINYEDLPLMYYLPNPIRGGLSSFRVEDDAVTPPRFLIMRPDVPFTYMDPLAREGRRYQWKREAVNIPSTIWGNNPDPEVESVSTRPVLILRRLDNVPSKVDQAH